MRNNRKKKFFLFFFGQIRYTIGEKRCILVKLIVQPNTKQYDAYQKAGAKGLLLGLRDFCNDFALTHTIDEIETVKKNFPDLEIFVSLDKMIYDSDLSLLKKHLLALDAMNITGILFYDFALLKLKQELQLKVDLVWNQTHMVTNYKTCEYYYHKGVKYAYLSSEITLDEMLEIKEKSQITCMALLYGYPVVAHSKRKLLHNYGTFLKQTIPNELTVTEPVSKQRYKIKENELGTTFFSEILLNGSKPYLEMLKHDFPYGILKEEGTDSSLFLEMVSSFVTMNETWKTKSDEEKQDWVVRMSQKMGSDHTGFFYQKTIYKVKKNEKS